MKCIRPFLFLLSFSSFFAMDNPREGFAARGNAAGSAASRTSNLAASAETFAAHAKCVREQTEARQSAEVYFDEAFIDLALDWFMSDRSPVSPVVAQQAAAPVVRSEEAEVDQDITRLNHLFTEWKNDPTNLGKREAVSELQVTLATKYASLLSQNPKLFKKLNNALVAVDEQKEKIVGQRNATKARASQVTSQEAPSYLSPRHSDSDINDAITSIRNARIKRANQYNTGAQIGAVASLGLAAFAFHRHSTEAAVASATCLVAGLYCAGKKYQLANSGVTRDQAIAFIEQQKRR